jgi:hypothetical protein
MEPEVDHGEAEVHTLATAGTLPTFVSILKL